jgi:hypothetical protein
MKTIPSLFGALCASLFCIHQAHAADLATNESGVQLTIELRDGSRVVGKSVEDALSFHSATLGDAKLPWSGIRSIEYAGTNTSASRLTAAAGDAFAVTLAADALRLETGFGLNEFPVKFIRSVKVSTPSMGTSGGAAALQLMIELRDGSHVVGKALDDSLSFHSAAMGDLKLAWAGIRSLQYAGTNTSMARLTATNSDVYEVQFEAAAVRVETSFGKTELPVNLIRSIKTLAAGNVTQGLIGWWKLDDGSGTVAKDSSQNPHDGTLVNGPVWTKTPGRDETCLQFNGQNQFVSFGNMLQGKCDELSIACWVKHSTSSWQVLASTGESWATPEGISMQMDYNNTSVTFGHYGSFPGGVNVKSKTNAQDGRWHHVVGTLLKSDSGYIYSIYVDGKLDNTESGPVGLAAASSRSPWTLGAGSDGSYAYLGLMSDFRIYDRALSPSEVQAIYEERNQGEPLPASPAEPRNVNLSDSIQIQKVIN